jgi:hypothetical protein
MSVVAVTEGTSANSADQKAGYLPGRAWTSTHALGPSRESGGLTPSRARPELDSLSPKRGGDGRVGDAEAGAKPRK